MLSPSTLSTEDTHTVYDCFSCSEVCKCNLATDNNSSNKNNSSSSKNINGSNNKNNNNNKRQFTPSEEENIQSKLSKALDVDNVQFRSNGSGGNVAYLEGWKAINIANEIFGFNGWNSEILQIKTEFADSDSNGRHTIGVSCRIRISLKDGTFHEDIGYGSGENQKSKAVCFDKAYKESVTDAMKRTLRLFGNVLGNCTYDKQFIKNLRAPRTVSMTANTNTNNTNTDNTNTNNTNTNNTSANNTNTNNTNTNIVQQNQNVGQWGNQVKLVKKSPPKFVVPQSNLNHQNPLNPPNQKKTSPLLECITIATTAEEEIIFDDLSQLEDPLPKVQNSQKQLNRGLPYDISSDTTTVMGSGSAGFHTSSVSSRGYKFGGHNHHGVTSGRHQVTVPLDQVYNGYNSGSDALSLNQNKK